MSNSVPVNQNISCYQIANVTQPETQPAANPLPVNTAPVIPANINDLFQKLVATGIITSISEQKEAKTTPPVKREKATSLRPVYFDKMDTLKMYVYENSKAIYQLQQYFFNFY